MSIDAVVSIDALPRSSQSAIVAILDARGVVRSARAQRALAAPVAPLAAAEVAAAIDPTGGGAAAPVAVVAVVVTSLGAGAGTAPVVAGRAPVGAGAACVVGAGAVVATVALPPALGAGVVTELAERATKPASGTVSGTAPVDGSGAAGIGPPLGVGALGSGQAPPGPGHGGPPAGKTPPAATGGVLAGVPRIISVALCPAACAAAGAGAASTAASVTRIVARTWASHACAIPTRRQKLAGTAVKPSPTESESLVVFAGFGW